MHDVRHRKTLGVVYKQPQRSSSLKPWLQLPIRLRFVFDRRSTMKRCHQQQLQATTYDGRLQPLLSTLSSVEML